MGESLEWQSCARWLADCGILPTNHVSLKDRDSTSLAKALRNGIILCKWMQKYAPESIDFSEVITRAGMSKFFSEKNVKLFLKACRDKFKMRERDLFLVRDLVDLLDFHSVIKCLSLLSQSEGAKKLGIREFCLRKSILQRTSSFGGSTPNPYYVNLQELDFDAEEDEDLYTRLLNDGTQEKMYLNMIGEESYVTMKEYIYINVPFRPDPNSVTDKVLLEILANERSYSFSLRRLIKNILHPARPILPEEQIATLFMNIEEISRVTDRFLREMVSSCSTPDLLLKKICETIQNMRLDFCQYAEYCAGLPFSRELGKQLLAPTGNPSFTKLFQDNEKESYGNVMTTPFRHYCGYHLYFERMLHKMAASHPLRQSVAAARDILLDIGEYMNEFAKDSKSIRAIKELHKIVQGFPTPNGLLEFGRLIKDGEISVRKKTRYIFLFDKVVFVCKRKADSYKFMEVIRLMQYKLEPGQGVDFLLLSLTDNTTVSFTSSNQQKKQGWLSAFRNADNRIQPMKKDNSLELLSITEPAECTKCKKLLHGCYFQAYRHVFVGGLFHMDCIPVVSKDTYPWFAGVITREAAEELLSERPDGTYLIRPSNDEFRLSLRFQQDDRHFTINCTDDEWWILENECFESIRDLVNYYRRNILKSKSPGRPDVNTILKIPYKQADSILYEANYDYSENLESTLKIVKDDVLAVVDEDESNWIHGENWEGQMGYFPRNYVRRMH